VPWETTAWSIEDMTPVRSGPPLRVGDQDLPFMDGELSRRSTLGVWDAVYRMVVNGHHDPYGDPYTAGYPWGIDDNIDILKRELLRPKRTSLTGTRTFKWIRDRSADHGGAYVRQAPAKLITDFKPEGIGNKALLTLTVRVPGGVLRSPTSTVYDGQVAGEDEDTLQVFNTGTADEMCAIVTFDGPGRITNTDYDNAWLEWRGTGAVIIDCDPGVTTALQGATHVDGDVYNGGGDNYHWLPLVPGQNDLVITAYDGGAIPTVTVEVQPPWL